MSWLRETPDAPVTGLTRAEEADTRGRIGLSWSSRDGATEARGRGGRVETP